MGGYRSLAVAVLALGTIAILAASFIGMGTRGRTGPGAGGNGTTLPTGSRAQRRRARKSSSEQRNTGVAGPTWGDKLFGELSTMREEDIAPERDAPEDVQLRAGRAVCALVVLGMPEVCGDEAVLLNASSVDPVEACATRHGPAALEQTLPRRCRRSQYWRELKRRVGLGKMPVVDRDLFATIDRGSGPTGHSPSPPAPTPRFRLRDPVSKAQVVDTAREQWPRYVPPSERTPLMNLPARICDGNPDSNQAGSGAVLNFTAHPISFGYPAELFADEATVTRRRRAWPFFPLVRPYNITHRPRGYPINEQDELLLLQLYRRSWFVFTHRRGGWDCWRHLEALAAGALPYLADLENCDRLCLAMYPKELFERILRLPSVALRLGRALGPHQYGILGGNATAALRVPANPEYFAVRPEVPRPTWINPRKVPEIDADKFDAAEAAALALEGYRYAKRHLTSASVVARILRVLGHEEPKNLLLVTRNHMDYMEFTIEHGLVSLGINYTVTFERPFLRKTPYSEEADGGPPTAAELEAIRAKKHLLWSIHGKGLGYAMRLPQMRNVAFVSDELKQRIVNREFDVVIFAYHWPPADQMPLVSTVAYEAKMPLDRVAIVDGNDNLQGSDWKHFLNGAARVGTLFHRELEDGSCRDFP